MEVFFSALCFFIIPILIGLAVLVAMGLKVVPEYERLVVFRLGRLAGERGPGVVIIIPFLESSTRVDLRETVLEIPHQVTITKDNAPISIDFLIYWRVVDPKLSVVQVKDFRQASMGIATTTLRAVLGDLTLDDALAKREQINTTLQVKLDEVTERWGVKITAVEIREIQPPKDVQDAMNRQMTAERTRRATVTEAEGAREAAILRAEGEKQASILEAEGRKESVILDAQAAQESQRLRGLGYAESLKEIEAVAKGLGDNTMSLQYLGALRDVGSSPSSKFIFPMEFTDFLRRFVDDGSKKK